MVGRGYRRRRPVLRGLAGCLLGFVYIRAAIALRETPSVLLRLIDVAKLGLYVRPMAKYSKGDMVVSVKDIGGVMRGFVPKGTEGVVVEAPWFGDPTVLFTITGALGGKKQVRINVSTTEIR